MDETLDRLISTATASASTGGQAGEAFIPSASWSGPKVGYYFGTADQGTGYYPDTSASGAGGGDGPEDDSARGRKRARFAAADAAAPEQDDAVGKSKTIRFGTDSTRTIPSYSRAKTGQELLAEAESALQESATASPFGSAAILTLTPSGIKSASAALARAIATNEMDRVKFSEVPAKFMRSEVMLNDVVESFKDVAADVSLYPLLIGCDEGGDEGDAVTSLVGLLGHDNGDVAASVIGVFAINVGKLANAVLEAGGLDAMAANLGRYDESIDEEKKGVDDILTVVEYMVDLDLAGVRRAARDASNQDEQDQDDEGDEYEDDNAATTTKNKKEEYKSTVEIILTSTTLLAYLLQRISTSSSKSSSSGTALISDSIALHCSEVLSSLLQHDDARIHAADITRLPPFKSAFDDGDDDDDDDDGKPSANGSNKDDDRAVDGMECILQSIAPYRKRDPQTEEEVETLENIYDALSACLLNVTNVQSFLDGQGVELMLRCMRNGGHGGFGACRVLYFATSGPSSSSASSSASSTTSGESSEAPYKRACEVLVEAGGLKQIFPIFMGRSSAIPSPAACSDAGRGLAAARKKSENGEKKKKKSAKKADAARKEWMREVEGNAIRIVYELTRHLDDSSPNESRNRVLAKFLEGDCEKCDRLVELCLKYDERARLAEYQYYRSDEAEELEQSGAVDIELAALNAKLRGGGDILHRVCAVAGFASSGSRRCHEHILEQLETQNSGMGVIKTALEEFASLLDEGPQKTQLGAYLSSL